jgi:hypothetical protein
MYKPMVKSSEGQRDRKIDVFFAVLFSVFTVTSLISDLLPTVGVDFSRPTGNFFVDSNGSRRSSTCRSTWCSCSPW